MPYNYTKLFNNFLNMSFDKQIEFIEIIYKNQASYSEYNNDIFYKNFIRYKNNLKRIIDNKKAFYKTKSIERRYIRYILFKEIYTIIENYDLFQDNKKTNTIYKKEKITDSQADEYIKTFNNLNNDEKDDFVYELNKIYINNQITLDKHLINKEYKDIMKKLIGKDLFKYYSLLSEEKKYTIINILNKIIEDTISKRKKDIIINDIDAVKSRKRNLLALCKDKLKNQNIAYLRKEINYEFTNKDLLNEALFNIKSIADYIGISTKDFEKNYMILLNIDDHSKDIEINCFKKDGNIFNYIFYKSNYSKKEKYANTIQLNIIEGNYVNHKFTNSEDEILPYTKSGHITDKDLLKRINNKKLSFKKVSLNLLQEIEKTITNDKYIQYVDTNLCILEQSNNTNQEYSNSYQKTKKKTIQRLVTSINNKNKMTS